MIIDGVAAEHVLSLHFKTMRFTLSGQVKQQANKLVEGRQKCQ